MQQSDGHQQKRQGLVWTSIFLMQLNH